MAREMKLILTDDLDGSANAQTVEFALDKTAYEIELGPNNAKKLRDALAPFIEKARKVQKVQTKKGKAASRSGSASNPELTAQIRQWAKDQGHEISARGRIPNDIIEAYNAAN